MKNPSPICAWTLVILGPYLAANFVSGQVMLSPAAVEGSDLGEYDPITALKNMINQSGVTTPFVSGSTDFNTYFVNPARTFAVNGGANNWQSNFSFDLPLTGHVDFDLGASYKINKMAIWNISVKDVTVKVADDLNGLETGQIAGSFTLVNHSHFPFSYAVEILSFGAEHQGRYVRLAIGSAYTFDVSDTFAYAIIGEVVMSVASFSPPSATLRVTLNANGDVTVTFTGTLQTSTKVDGTFVDVTGNPQGIYTLSKANLESQQYFRAKGN